jgi:hypothetical protein
VANTQTRPKIDHLVDFYRHLHENIESTKSFSSFVNLLTGKHSLLFNDLYHGLRQQKGWGEKTAALFTKAVYQVHDSYGKEFEFWSDTPRKISRNDQIWLPVDAVIIHVFKELGMTSPSFKKINELLKQHYSGDDLEVWDDLWFWGFITQRGSGDSRLVEWNENKYWSLTHTIKDPTIVSRIKEKSGDFIDLL